MGLAVAQLRVPPTSLVTLWDFYTDRVTVSRDRAHEIRYAHRKSDQINGDDHGKERT